MEARSTHHKGEEEVGGKWKPNARWDRCLASGSWRFSPKKRGDKWNASFESGRCSGGGTNCTKAGARWVSRNREPLKTARSLLRSKTSVRPGFCATVIYKESKINVNLAMSLGMIWLACSDVFPMRGEVRVRDLRFDHQWNLEKSSHLLECEDLNLDLMLKCWDTSSDDPDLPCILWVYDSGSTMVARKVPQASHKPQKPGPIWFCTGIFDISAWSSSNFCSDFQQKQRERFSKDTFGIFCVLCC